MERFVEGHVVRALLETNACCACASACRSGISNSKAQRLTTSSPNGCEYEATRVPFTVLETEEKTSVSIAGLTLNLRLDRIDRLNDGSLLVIDYKTGDVSPNPGTCRAPTTCNCRSTPASRWT